MLDILLNNLGFAVMFLFIITFIFVIIFLLLDSNRKKKQYDNATLPSLPGFDLNNNANNSNTKNGKKEIKLDLDSEDNETLFFIDRIEETDTKASKSKKWFKKK